jgi:hypothetical protein
MGSTLRAIPTNYQVFCAGRNLWEGQADTRAPIDWHEQRAWLGFI